jgi:hypothetical protein
MGSLEDMYEDRGRIKVEIGPEPECDTTVTFPPPGAPVGAFWLMVVPGEGRPRFSVGIVSTDEGIVIDVWPEHGEMGESLGTTAVFDQDVIDALAEMGGAP